MDRQMSEDRNETIQWEQEKKQTEERQGKEDKKDSKNWEKEKEQTEKKTR
jgi:hypothetical protein